MIYRLFFVLFTFFAAHANAETVFPAGKVPCGGSSACNAFTVYTLFHFPSGLAPRKIHSDRFIRNVREGVIKTTCMVKANEIRSLVSSILLNATLPDYHPGRFSLSLPSTGEYFGYSISECALNDEDTGEVFTLHMMTE